MNKTFIKCEDFIRNSFPGNAAFTIRCFRGFMRGKTCPLVDGEAAIYESDWQAWLNSPDWAEYADLGWD